MKVSQNVCIDVITVPYEHGSSGSITRSLGQILENLVLAIGDVLFIVSL